MRRGLCYTDRVTSLYLDTHPKIEKIQLELIRRMPSWKKFELVDDINKLVKTIALNGIRQRHPQATEHQIKRMMADLLLGEELANKVYDHAR